MCLVNLLRNTTPLNMFDILAIIIRQLYTITMKEVEKEIFNFEHPFAEEDDYKRKLKMRFARMSSL